MVALRILETKKGDRLNSHIFSILKTQAGAAAISVFVGAMPRPGGNEVGGIGTMCPPGRVIMFPLSRLIEKVWKYEEMEEIRLHLELDQFTDDFLANNSIGSSIGSNIVAEFFLYCSMALEWVKNESPIMTAYEKWPETLNFARTIRNAIAHGGSITVQSPNAVTGSWNGRKYTCKDKGRRVIPHEIAEGDLILLMFDVDEELTRLHAPLVLG